MKFKEIKQDMSTIRYFKEDSEKGIDQLEYAFFDSSNKHTKYLIFTKDSDFKISGLDFLSVMEDNNIKFDIEDSDLLYPIFDKFMKNNDSYIIESDDVTEYNQKYIKFKKIKNKIQIEIFNKKIKSPMQRFNIFVKNVVTDYRSKCDMNNLDYKSRLNELFNDIELFFETYTNDRQKTLKYSE